MSLEGSLQTVALSEVLHLLADTSKGGELRVHGAHSGGQLWFESGKLSGFEVGRTTAPADALFDLLRITDGDFVFDAGASRPDSAQLPEGGEPVELHPVLGSVQVRLDEWAEIVTVVPSLDHEVTLAEGSPDRGVRLEGDQWSLVVAIGEGRSVQAVLDRRGLPEFDGCRSIKALVDAELVTVSEPAHEVAASEPVFQVSTSEPAGVAEFNGHSLVFNGTDAADVAPLDGPEVEETVDHTNDSEEVAAEAEQPADAGEPEEAVEAAEPVEAHDEAATLPDGYNESAAIVESSEPEATDDAGYHDGHGDYVHDEVQPHDVSDNGGPPPEVSEARAALQALLEEIGEIADDPAETELPTATAEPDHDGLADRGPWTMGELASLTHNGSWYREEPIGGSDEQSNGVHDEVQPDEVQPADVQQDFYGTPAEVHANGNGSGDSNGEGVGSPGETEREAEPSGEAEPEAEVPEPINRGLLLKFLSSVRS